jgi:hypothetical protein
MCSTSLENQGVSQLKRGYPSMEKQWVSRPKRGYPSMEKAVGEPAEARLPKLGKPEG